MFLIRNYNRFLVTTEGTWLHGKFRWENFYIHRHETDFKRLLLFQTYEEAEQFVEDNSEQLEEDFDAWIEEVCPEDWMSHSSPWEPRKVHEYSRQAVLQHLASLTTA